MCNKRFFGVLFVLVLMLSSCTISVGQDGIDVPPSPDMGGGSTVESRGFKIPLPQGYNWQITQSWAEHCGECNLYYHDWDYCDVEMSHMWNCCRYGWDFSLPGREDEGKPVLASSGGIVKESKYNNSWGSNTMEHDIHRVLCDISH